LARVSEFTPRKKLVYDRFQKKESGLCNLRKNSGQNLKFISYFERNILMEGISTFLNADVISILKGIF